MSRKYEPRDRSIKKVIEDIEAEYAQIAVELLESPAKSFEEYLRRVHKAEGMKSVFDAINSINGKDDND